MNKKLFKGALVLCASILMAVSCQSNSKPGDEEKDNSATAQFSLALKKATDGKVASTTLGAFIKAASSGTMPATPFDIELNGTDITDKNNYDVAVKSATFLAASAKSGKATSSISTPSGTATTYSALDGQNSKLKPANIVLDQSKKGKLSLSFNDSGNTLGNALYSALSAKANYGIMKVDFEVSEKSTSKKVLLTVYIELGRAE